MNSGPYARVYHSIVDDPKFARVFGDDRALATWLRLLLVADAMYPTSAPLPAKTKAVQLLIEVGLIVEQPGNRYVVKGLAPEREKRAQSARNAAAVRWQSGSNASKAEQSKAKTSNGADAHEPGTFLGFRPKVSASSADIRQQDEDAWRPCSSCGVIGRKHSASGDHPFTAAPTGVGA